MINYISRNYNIILAIFILYFILNIFKDSLIYQYFNIAPYESVKDGYAYWQAVKVRNIFIFINKIVFPLMGIISLVLLIAKKENKVEKWVKIGVVLFIAFIIFISIISGNFS